MLLFFLNKKSNVLIENTVPLSFKHAVTYIVNVSHNGIFTVLHKNRNHRSAKNTNLFTAL